MKLYPDWYASGVSIKFSNKPLLPDLMGGHIYKTWTGVHGPPHAPGPIGPPFGPGPWTNDNFQKQIAPVNMKIYRSSGYEKHRLRQEEFENTSFLFSSRRKTF